MRKVLHCSDFVVNIISISVLTDSGIITQFTKNYASLSDTNGNLIITEIHIRRMYYLSENSMTSILAMRAKSRKIAVRMNIWYRRLGHIDKRTIKMLIQ